MTFTRTRMVAIAGSLALSLSLVATRSDGVPALTAKAKCAGSRVQTLRWNQPGGSGSKSV